VRAALAFALAACGSDPSAPCDGAKSGEACRWAGTGDRGLNPSEASRLDSQLYFPTDLAFGADGRAYIADYNNHMIRRVDRDQVMRVVVGMSDVGPGVPTCGAPGDPGTTIAINHPTQVRFGADGLLYFAAWRNNEVLTLDPQSGVVANIAGGPVIGYTGDGGAACAATFTSPSSVAIAPDGTVFVTDQASSVIRQISPPPERIVTTLAVLDPQVLDLAIPAGAVLVAGDALYAADSANHRIVKVDLASAALTTIAGTGQAGYSGDGGPASAAQLDYPTDLELGPDGRLYVADRYNSVIRVIDLTAGTIATVAGDGTACDNTSLTCPDRATAGAMQLAHPNGIAFDAAGNLFIADTDTQRIIEVVR